MKDCRDFISFSSYQSLLLCLSCLFLKCELTLHLVPVSIESSLSYTFNLLQRRRLIHHNQTLCPTSTNFTLSYDLLGIKGAQEYQSLTCTNKLAQFFVDKFCFLFLQKTQNI